MSELEEMFQDFKLEYGLDQCTVCSRPTVTRDTIGFPWCEEHAHHGKVMSWGRRHGYPETDLLTYQIGQGEHAWWIAAVASASTAAWKGDEGYMWTALAYIEDIERQEIAS